MALRDGTQCAPLTSEGPNNSSTTTRRSFLEKVFFGLFAAFAWPRQSYARPDICEDKPLIDALRIIHRACTPMSCDPASLRVLDDPRHRSTLLSILRNHELNVVHIFFPSARSELRECFDWESIRRVQLNTFQNLNNAEHSTVYLVGRASGTGDIEFNRHLSAARMQSVYNYLRYELKIRCREFRGVWLGKEVSQFTIPDATMIGLQPSEYRNDELVLNQAVHVFAVACDEANL